jgi:hypothetical protein
MSIGPENATELKVVTEGVESVFGAEDDVLLRRRT